MSALAADTNDRVVDVLVGLLPGDTLTLVWQFPTYRLVKTVAVVAR